MGLPGFEPGTSTVFIIIVKVMSSAVSSEIAARPQALGKANIVLSLNIFRLEKIYTTIPTGQWSDPITLGRINASFNRGRNERLIKK